MNCGVGHRRSSDPMLLWLWHRSAAAAPIRPLAQEFSYAPGVPPPKKRIVKIDFQKNDKNKVKQSIMLSL